VNVRREWLERDYYEILGVDRAATEKEITRAYRKLAKQYHPDNNPGDTEAEARFKEVSEAHSVIGDTTTRKQYDEAREMFSRGTFVGGPGGGAQYVRIDDLGDIGDLLGGGMFGGLGDLFGVGDRSRRAPRRGRDLETEVALSFHEAVNGTTRTLNVGSRNGPATVKVKIPAGVDDGARIRLRGKGEPGAGGQAGDLYVRVHVGSHPLFERSGRDLRIEVPISYTEAALGAEVTVPTLDGKVTLRVPPGTPTGKTLRVSGKGIATKKGTGDLLVKLEIQVPGETTPEMRGLLEQLRELESDQNPRSHLGV
jgi:molecular chaperone DnaJ